MDFVRIPVSRGYRQLDLQFSPGARATRPRKASAPWTASPSNRGDPFEQGVGRCARCGRVGSKFNQDMDRRFQSLVTFTRAPAWVLIFDQQPCQTKTPCNPGVWQSDPFIQSYPSCKVAIPKGRKRERFWSCTMLGDLFGGADCAIYFHQGESGQDSHMVKSFPLHAGAHLRNGRIPITNRWLPAR